MDLAGGQIAQTAAWRSAARVGAILLLMVGAKSVPAAEYCVGTLTELNAALDAAVDPANAGVTTTVMLKTGTYHIGATRMTQYGKREFNALELLGGYNSDCSARTINADTTIFDGDNTDTGVWFDPLADLLIEGIRFQNIGPLYHDVSIYPVADNVTVRLRLNAFVGVQVYIDGFGASGLVVKFGIEAF